MNSNDNQINIQQIPTKKNPAISSNKFLFPDLNKISNVFLYFLDFQRFPTVQKIGCWLLLDFVGIDVFCCFSFHFPTNSDVFQQ